MKKNEFKRRLGEILEQVQAVKDIIENFDIDSITESMEELKNDAEETIENIRSEALRDEWQERVDSLDSLISQVSELGEAFDTMEDIITEFESLE